MTDQPPRKKAKEETEDNYAALRSRMRQSWPKEWSENVQLSEETIAKIYVDHAVPHDNCSLEWWNVCGKFGKDSRFSLFAFFFRFAVIDEEEPPRENDAVTYAAAVSWAIIDNKDKKYYRFSELDHRAPLIGSYLAATGAYHGDEHFIHAMIEQFSQGRLPLPDRTMPGPTSLRLGTLELDYNGNQLAVVTHPHGCKKTPFPCYKVQLTGTTYETGDEKKNEEVKAVVELTLQPIYAPVLHGSNGVVGVGDDWVCDSFYYFMPHCSVVEGDIRVTRASDEKELVKESNLKDGTFWIEHRFGGAIPRTLKEAMFVRNRLNVQVHSGVFYNFWNRCLIRLNNEAKDAVGVIFALDNETGKVSITHAAMQCGKTGKSERYDENVEFTPDASSQYRGEGTGLLFPTRWTLCTPFRDNSRLEVKMEATFPAQEFVTAVAMPSFWLGSVHLSGRIIASDGTVEDVTGDGFVETRGQGDLDTPTKLHDVLREVTTAVMEKSEFKMLSVSDIAAAPAASATSTVKILLSLQDQVPSDAQLVMLSAFLGVYGYIFHHPDSEKDVLEQLRWCHGKWLSYFGSFPVDNKTIMLRAFMLRELTHVLKKRCGSWIPSHIQAVDIVMNPPQSIVNLLKSTERNIDCIIPTDDQIKAETSPLEVSQLKAVVHGTWLFDSKRCTGSIGTYLAAQGVPLVWRTFITSQEPILVANVDDEKHLIRIVLQTSLTRREHITKLNGVEWYRRSPGKGDVRSRACILPAGKGIYMETLLLATKQIERRWYTFTDGGKTMIKTMQLFENSSSKEPMIGCAQYFTLNLTKNSSNP